MWSNWIMDFPMNSLHKAKKWWLHGFVNLVFHGYRTDFSIQINCCLFISRPRNYAEGNYKPANHMCQFSNAMGQCVTRLCSDLVLPEHSILNPSSDPPPHWWWRSLIASVYLNEYLLHLWIFKVCVDQTRSSMSSRQGQHNGLNMLNTCFVEIIWVSQNTLSKIYFILGITSKMPGSGNGQPFTF